MIQVGGKEQDNTEPTEEHKDWRPRIVKLRIAVEGLEEKIKKKNSVTGSLDK